ncbi:MAG: acyl-ACP--UDP-N-acetylglucosamine O-acyltransferase [Alphaproteobacteria bacterium]|nr:acyl-ACP--UDP-N-acetylglucosamine O-acyltransferase [Alphaproteobacteria bacterium]
MAGIHSTAIVDSRAKLGDGVTIGPYCTVGGDVVLGDHVELVSHVVAAGHTEIGANTRIFPFATVGLPPQDLKYKGEPTRLVVGRDCIIREHATLHPGTAVGGGLTSVGDGCLLMVACHVAHDCKLGNKVILTNNATLGGHVQVGDHAMMGGLSAVHQYVRIGQHAMVGGMTGVEGDVIPYGLVMGDRARLAGLNLVGLKRRGFSRDEIHALRAAYRMLFAAEGTLAERLDDVTELFGKMKVVMDIVEFIRADANRPICQPKNGVA